MTKTASMKKINTLLISLFLALTQYLQAQEFQGVATYNTSTSLDMKLDSNVANAEQQKAIMQMLAPYLKKEYTLTFSKTNSLYREVEKLQQNQMPFSDIIGSVMGTGGVFYKNVQSSESLRQLEFMGKMFLVTDTLEKLDWKLGKESKMIGSYTCYKATATREVTEKSISSSAESDELKEEDEKKLITITAWYTPQIPVSQGPDNYWGLPGLIMEINDGTTTILCSQVVLNPKEKVEIKRPKEGEKVTQQEFRDIMVKKAEEMREMYGGQGQGAGNSEFKIQIPN